MANKIFISYRRADSFHAVHAIASQLGARFGPGQVFMDVRSIPPGHSWPPRLRRELSSSSVVLAVIGPTWLKYKDQNGQYSRLRLKHDWVRQELAMAFKKRLCVIPLYFADARVIESNDLPPSIQELASQQKFVLHGDSWVQDLITLGNYLIAEHGFAELYPEKQVGHGTVRRRELRGVKLKRIMILLNNRGWDRVERVFPGEYRTGYHELRKSYTFNSFKEAMLFMSKAAEICEKFKPYRHHPRWENMMNLITVWLTTWDVKHKITDLDTRMAIAFDKLYDNITKTNG